MIKTAKKWVKNTLPGEPFSSLHTSIINELLDSSRTVLLLQTLDNFQQNLFSFLVVHDVGFLLLCIGTVLFLQRLFER